MVDSASSADRARLIEMVHGYRTTCMIVAAMELGLFDALRAGPVDEPSLAGRLGTHPPSLHRFLRGLGVLGLTEHRAEGFALTALGRLLVDDDATVRERAILAGAEYLPAWKDLQYSVATGDPAFDRVFGMSAWEHRARHPELNDCMNRTMADDLARAGRAVSTAYDFSRFRLVVDVGGGQGALMAEILHQWPQPAGIVFDQPHVVAGAPAILTAAGVQDRCRIAGGSFFDSVPGGGDAYVLQHVLHDWNDERCLAILSKCRAAMDAGSVLLVVENVVADDGRPTAHVALLDLHMMVMLGGRERTRGELASLLQAAGFTLVRSLRTPATAEILEAVAS